MARSRYTIVVDNLSSTTRTADLEYEFKYAGRIRELVKDSKARCALIEYDRGADAEYAYRKLHGITLNGRQLKVEYATPSDFKFFGWKWTEGGRSPSPVRRSGRSPSPSPVKKSHRSRSRSSSRDSRSPSRSPSRSRPDTPHNKEDGQRGTATASISPSQQGE